jgi:hypothetical protein
MNATVIRRAKRYAEQNGRSLSLLVENYFKRVTMDLKGQHKRTTPVVGRLVGAARGAGKTDWRKGYTSYLEKKYT